MTTGTMIPPNFEGKLPQFIDAYSKRSLIKSEICYNSHYFEAIMLLNYRARNFL